MLALLICCPLVLNEPDLIIRGEVYNVETVSADINKGPYKRISRLQVTTRIVKVEKGTLPPLRKRFLNILVPHQSDPAGWDKVGIREGKYYRFQLRLRPGLKNVYWARWPEDVTRIPKE
jgi:hypothetical protein